MTKKSSKKEDKEERIEMENRIYSEDENGYVNTAPNRVSLDTIKRLPSRNIDGLFKEEESLDGASQTLSKRKMHYNSIRFKSATLSSRSVNVGVQDIYQLLMDNAERTKLEQLRDMHQTLTLKRMVKSKIDAENIRLTESRAVDRHTRWKLKAEMGFQRFKRNLKSFFERFDIWHNDIKSVEGRFGSGVASYFVILRWLLYLNCCSFFLTFMFVVIPQLLFDSSDQAAHHVNQTFHFQDILTGEDWMTDTIFFFGHYTNYTTMLYDGSRYSMTSAYLCTLGANVLMFLLVLMYSLTVAYDTHFIETSSSIPHVFSSKVFCAWDYTIATEDAAKIRKQCVYKELEEMISEKFPIRVEDNLCNNIVQLIFMLILHIFVISSIGSIGYLTYYLLQTRSLIVSAEILRHLTLPLFVTTVYLIFYVVLTFATKIEYYFSKKHVFYLTITRVVILRSLMIAVIVYFWLAIYAEKAGLNGCYETYLGCELYRLMWVNFAMDEIFGSLVAERLRRFIHNNCYPPLKLAEFDVAYNLLNLIYYQSLVWLGGYSSPMLPFLLIIILVCHFHLKLRSVKNNCRPSRNAWNATAAKSFFLTLALLSFLLAEFAVYYIIFVIPPSHCGPLKNYVASTEALKPIFGFSKDKQAIIIILENYLSSSGFLFTIVVGLGLAVYYVRENSQAYKQLVDKLENQLEWIGKDKIFLLNVYDAALKEKAANDGKHGPRRVVFNQFYDHDYDLHPPPSTKVLERFDPGYKIIERQHQTPLKKSNLPTPSHKQPFQYIIEGKPPPRTRNKDQ